MEGPTIRESATGPKNRLGSLSPLADRAWRKKRFEGEFEDWIAAQNARFEVPGIPGEDLRPW